ncbi:cadmium-translocating P-type ATPase [Glaciecola sp. XM2]|jgi:Cu2+-exporting ATPase|uniref:heavy metal translocating P-type ATPase n=1 Tax=Glaciecola sp. XM2 TaxID=1914931 RepID=UPI001BDE1F4C|nr:heavy metal translocating P-type ATPase [Glaciecola sp. XM2]MBT1449638.1 cadmium-translocating P-type ATPase [Glaciecola sp. XM2]
MSIVIQEGGCFHCGLPNTEGDAYPVTIVGQVHYMCCPGCQAVASAIVDNGLESYYEFRTEPAARGDAALDNTMAKLQVYDEPELQEEFVFDQGVHKQIQLTVEGITCAACGWLIEKQLAKLQGIRQVSVNVSARRALITWDNDILKLSGILGRMKSIGYESLPFQTDRHEASYQKEQKSYLKKVGLAGIMTMQVMMLAMGQYFDVFGNIDQEMVQFFNAICLLLTTPVVLYSGSVFYVSALKALQAKTVNMDVPVSIAIIATYIAGVLAVNKSTGEVYFESICMFIFFLLISRFLEHRSRHRASEISSNMLKLIPVTAMRWAGDAWQSVLAKQLVTGDKVLVKAGENIPIDGVVLEGQSTVDESMLTGEFEPVRKGIHDRVFAGALNQQGSLSIEVTSSLKYAMMNQILRLQEVAMSSKPKVALIADKLSRYFVTIVLIISALTYWYWWSQDDPHAFWITISVLVATCPCALGLATPSALTCAMAKLNKVGILLKRADALEQVTYATDIIFDKTGTLTRGEFSISKHQFTSNSARIDTPATQDLPIETYLSALAQVLESRSEHPIAKAYGEIDTRFKFDLSEYVVEIGRGIRAKVNNVSCVMGSKKFVLHETQQKDDADWAGANVLMAVNSQVVAAFWVTDTIKEDVAEVIDSLHEYDLSILSGDDQGNVEMVANQLHIDTAMGGCTPEAKLDYIQKQQANHKSILMLGDGINDAPVLAAADVSIAVGNASDLAKNAADVVLLNPKLTSLSDVVTMAHRTKRKIKQNIAWALSYNLLVLPFAVSGVLTPWQAALGMSLSSVIVVYNSTRLMR